MARGAFQAKGMNFAEKSKAKMYWTIDPSKIYRKSIRLIL